MAHLPYAVVKATADLHDELGNKEEVARRLNIGATSVRRHLKTYQMYATGVIPMNASELEEKPSIMQRTDEGDPVPVFLGQAEPEELLEMPLPPEGCVYNYILTCAQNNTYVNKKAWRNFMALADHYKARVMISRFTYNPNNFGSLSTKPGTAKKLKVLAFDSLIDDYVCDRQIVLAPGLQWCGKSNIMPTNSNPLAALDSHTGRRSAIYPHPRIAMKSVASGKYEATKLMFTTGAVTEINYIQKLPGQKAEHHHSIAALLVQVNSKGHWYCRQLNADRYGAIFDADIYAHDGKVRKHSGTEAIVFGDLHAVRAAPEVLDMAQDMMDTLNPDKAVLHDVLDFHSRSHHGMKDPFEMFLKFIHGEESVESELKKTAEVIRERFCRRNMETVIVNANHDRHLERWVKDADWKRDPVNAICYLDLAKAQLEAIAANDNNFMLAEYALQAYGLPKNVRMLRVDESYVVLKDRSGGIELGYHGDLGRNGARGNIRQYAQMGRKTVIGHSHSAGIDGGCYQVGTSSQLDLGYNSGPGSWSWTHCIIHANGKRQLVTMYDGAWRGEGDYMLAPTPWLEAA